MLDNFFNWFYRNRKTIGYTIGGLNLVSGIGNLLNGEIVTGVVFVVLGLALILDARMFK
jgi:hypothetical protein